MKIHFIKTPDTREIYPPSGFSYVMAEIMKEAGCVSLLFGVESGSQQEF